VKKPRRKGEEKRKQKKENTKKESVLGKQERDRKQTGHEPEEKRTIMMNKKLA
jgi:hypothetical protein